MSIQLTLTTRDSAVQKESVSHHCNRVLLPKYTHLDEDQDHYRQDSETQVRPAKPCSAAIPASPEVLFIFLYFFSLGQLPEILDSRLNSTCKRQYLVSVVIAKGKA